MCKYLMKNFRRINDVRGNWFNVPDESSKSMVCRRKLELIKADLNIQKVPKGSIIALHHFAPRMLLRDFYQVQKHKDGKNIGVYRWVKKADQVNCVACGPRPNYSMTCTLEDLKKARCAIADGPFYEEKDREATKHMVMLLMKEKKALSNSEKKQVANFSCRLRRQKRNGRDIPIEKEVALKQAGFDFVGRVERNERTEET